MLLLAEFEKNPLVSLLLVVEKLRRFCVVICQLNILHIVHKMDIFEWPRRP